MTHNTEEDRHPQLQRLSTGNAELDAILGGGFPANSLNILMGEPGSGKTILAERLMFANAEPEGRPIHFLTTLSEPADKVVRYLQQFSFYDPEMMLGAINYSSIGMELAQDGVGALVPLLRALILEHRPKIIVIDSFKAIHDLSTSVPEMRRMLYEVGGLLTAYETTAFFVGEYSADQISIFPEFAVADAMVELSRSKLSTRDERFLRVLKLRGSQYQEGFHAFRIGRDGLEVFPRLVTPDAPPSYDILTERVQVGVAGLDKLLNGGLYRGRSTFVLGQTGAGKTTLSMQFVMLGISLGEQCMYVSFEENPTQFDTQLRALGLGAEDPRRKNLHRLYVSPVELQIDSIVAQLYRTVRNFKIQRIVIDAVGDLLLTTADPQRLHNYLYALAQHFAVEGVSSVFTYETIGRDLFSDTRMSALADNIFYLGVNLSSRRAHRTLRIIKARGIAHDLDEHDLKISADGVEVL